ncbi:hypothetical protein [Acidovorax lacteus]|uniref:hypothetical protein n=1 Tax=Acidovorax lacteus TaxID=1924988 RepID=UPI0031EF5CB8
MIVLVDVEVEKRKAGKTKTAGLFSFGGCVGEVSVGAARRPLIRRGQRSKTKNKTRCGEP